MREWSGFLHSSSLSLVFEGNGRKERSRRPSTEPPSQAAWHRAPSTPEMGWGCSCCGSSYF